MSEEHVIYMNKENEPTLMRSLGINESDIDNYSVIRAMINLMIDYNTFVNYKNRIPNLSFGIKEKLANTYHDYHIEKWLASLCNLILVIKDTHFPVNIEHILSEDGHAFYEEKGVIPKQSYYDNIKIIRNKVQHTYNNFLDIAKTQIILKKFKEKITHKSQAYQVYLVENAIAILKERYGDKLFLPADMLTILKKS